MSLYIFNLKNTIKFLLFLIPMVLILSFSAYSKEVARLSVHWSPKHHCAKHAQMFAEKVYYMSEGKLRIEVFPSKQLFGIREVMGAVTSGAVELGGIVGVVSFPPINKNFNIASFPGLFSSYDEQRGFFKESDIGSEIWSKITEKTNSKLIMYNPVGPVMTFSSARELKGIDSMKDLKARRLLKSEVPMWKAYGSKYVSMPTGEVYTSLQSGMIDTINSPPQSIGAYDWWEFLKYAQKPYQYFADAYIMANSDWFNSLSTELQEIVIKAGNEVGAISTNTILGAGENTLSEFQKRGGIITTLAGSEKDKFDKLMNDKVMPEMAKMMDSKTLDAAKKYVSQK